MRYIVVDVVRKGMGSDNVSAHKSLPKNKIAALAMIEIRQDEKRKWLVSGLGCLGLPSKDGRPQEKDILRELSNIRMSNGDASEPPVIYTWGGSQVDLPLLYIRGMAHGWPLPWIHDLLGNKSKNRHIDLREVMTYSEAVDHLPFGDLVEAIGGPVSFPFMCADHVMNSRSDPQEAKQSYTILSAYAQVTVALVSILALKHMFMGTEISPSQHDELVGQVLSILRKKEETYSRNYKSQEAALVFRKFLQEMNLERLLYRLGAASPKESYALSL